MSEKRRRTFSEALSSVPFSPYLHGLPEILLYQALTKTALAVCIFALKHAAAAILWAADKPAITSSDIPFLLRTWQGWLILCIGALALFAYAAFDVNAMIIMSRNILHQQGKRITSVIAEGVSTLPRLLSPVGFLAVAYLAFIAPLAFRELGISLSFSLVVPDFIMSVVLADPATAALWRAFQALTVFVNVSCILTFHFIVLGDLSPKDAIVQAFSLFRREWCFILKRYAAFLAKAAGVLAIVAALCAALPLAALELSGAEGSARHTALIFTLALSLIGFGGFLAVFGPLQFVCLTSIYEALVDPSEAPRLPRAKRGVFFGCTAAAAVALCAGIAVLAAPSFNQLFPTTTPVQVIAHRGGGFLSTENTAESIAAAAQHRVYASEIDVQRTKDGRYVVHHDNTFKRLCGVDRAVSDMTLDEIKGLSVRDPNDPARSVPIATLEEALEAAKGRVHLYIELKGPTADRAMADDVYRAVRDAGMLEQCSIIGLDYDLIDYVESEHPDAQTLYLCFYALGNLEDLNADGIGLEAESATPENVERIKEAGKRVDVWTCNEPRTLARFLFSEVDGVITDRIDLAEETLDAVASQSDLGRVAFFATSNL